MKKRSVLLPIFLVVLVDILAMTIILPLLPFYAQKFGATPAVVGLLVTTFAACQLLSGPLLGQLSDRFGRKPLLLISQIGTLSGLLVLGFSHSLALIFVSRVIDGVTAGNLSLAQAYISDVTTPENRAKAFGIMGVAFGIGFLLGPALSGFFSHFGYSTPIFLAAGLSFLSIVATSILIPSVAPSPDRPSPEGPPPPAGRRLSLLQWGDYFKYFQRPELGNLLAEFFLFVFGFSLFTSGFALFAERAFTTTGISGAAHAVRPWGPREVGYVFAYTGFLGIILQGGLLGRLVKRFGESRLAITGFFSVAIGSILLGLAGSMGRIGVHSELRLSQLPTLLLGITIASFGTGVLRPVLTSLVTQRVGRGEQGFVLGLTQSLSSLAQITAPVVAGLMIEHGLLSDWAWTIAGIGLFGFILTQIRASREVRQLQKPSRLW